MLNCPTCNHHFSESENYSHYSLLTCPRCSQRLRLVEPAEQTTMFIPGAITTAIIAALLANVSKIIATLYAVGFVVVSIVRFLRTRRIHSNTARFEALPNDDSTVSRGTNL